MSHSKPIIKYYQSLVYWCNKLENASACWKAKEQADITYTEEERVKIYKANELLEMAKSLVQEVYSKRIGEAVIRDVNIGEYK